MKDVLALIGAAVAVMYVLGATGNGDFLLCFGVKTVQCVKEAR